MFPSKEWQINIGYVVLYSGSQGLLLNIANFTLVSKLTALLVFVVLLDWNKVALFCGSLKPYKQDFLI